MARKPDYITVWGYGEFRDLVLGIVAGAVFSFIGSYYGKKYVSFHLSHTSAGLAKGYALLIGIVVSLLVAAVWRWSTNPSASSTSRNTARPRCIR